MGQKINPLGFRLGITQSHHSFWFAQPQNYSESLQEDQKIRDFIKNYIQKNSIEKNKRIYSGTEGIARIEIKKRINLIEVIIFMGFPKFLIESKPRGFKELQINLQKEFHYLNQKLNIAIERITKPYRNANIIAEFIAVQLKNRVSFQKVMEKAIELTEEEDIKGIQIQISGPLGGRAAKSSVEWIRQGRIPFQTITAKIDYCSHKVRTKYGVLGIKVWIFIDK
uniref:Small ribosomal subunit protein uS3c n=2 Tax=Phelipanche TaxID=320805 RepID=A0A1B1YYK5_9LAMI|nr:ribosomal protein S3 [Phelipanche aegyptiaca]ANX10254.1 ribosomal protein S3 [Phelipanche lavandulacea]